MNEDVMNVVSKRCLDYTNTHTLSTNFINREPEDLIQESFLKLITSLKSYDEKKSKVTSFAVVCTNNLFKDLHRKSKTNKCLIYECVGEDDFKLESLCDSVSDIEYQIFLEQALNDIELFILKAKMAKYTYEEISSLVKKEFDLKLSYKELKKCFIQIMQRLAL